MPQQTKIFRVFISSTFTDMKVERSILQKKVFPKLAKFCEENGARFQAVDLRWGVNEESSRNQKTVEICLNEILRCQKLSPRPNFLVLLGDRYGWQPIPSVILQSEMESILPHLQPGSRKLVDDWYKLDKNAVPAEYILQSWGNLFKEYKEWEIIENQLRKILRETAKQANLSIDALLKYTTSATHQEIISGVLNPPHDVMDPESHVLAFSRTIMDIPTDDRAGNFVDLVEGKWDHYSKTQVEVLRGELKDKLKDHFIGYNANWNRGEIQLEDEQKFIEDAIGQLKFVIDSELKKIVDEEEIKQEIRYHKEFAETMTTHFLGREDCLKRIFKYLNNNDAKQILSLIGASGSGKTCVMAKVVLETQKRNVVLVYRFLGANAKSSNIVSLLTSICGQIALEYGTTLESLLNTSQNTKYFDINILIDLFKNCLALAKEEKPLFLFFDALDQLSETDNALTLNWLPRELSAHAHIIVSCVPEIAGILNFTEVYHLPLMRRATGKKLLDVWLDSHGRTLARKQKRAVLGKFKKNRLPLFLKIAFEQAKKWHSYDPPAKFSGFIPDLIEQYFADLEREHSQPLVSKAVGYLLSGKDKGLTEDEILNMLWFDKEYWQYFLENSHPDHRKEVEDTDKLPMVVWSRLFLDLAPYLTERDSYGERIIGFYHRQFNEILKKKYLQDEILTHQKLGEYFSSRPNFFDGENQKKPNVRKCVEQPWQMTQGEMWDEVTNTLCDLDFIQAKACARMAFDLVHDINSVLQVIPDNKENIRRERELKDKMVKYTHDLIIYAKGKSKTLEVPESIEPSSQEKMNENIVHIEKEPQRIDRLNAFIQFLGIEVGNLQTHAWEFPYFAVQQAWNHAKNGPVGEEVGQHPKEVLGRLLLKTGANRPSWYPHSEMLKQLKGHTNAAYAVDVIPDGTLAVSGSWDNTLIVWDLNTGILLHRLEGHSDSVTSVVITSDGRRAVSGSEDKTLIVWDLHTGKSLRQFAGHTEGVKSLSVTPDCRLAVSVSHDQTLIVWNLDTGKPLYEKKLKGYEEVIENRLMQQEREREREIENHRQRGMGGRTLLINRGLKDVIISNKKQKINYIEAVSLSPDGRTAVLGFQDNTLIIWDLKSGKPLRTLYGNTASVNTMVVTPDGRRAVSGSEENTLIVWDLETGKILVSLEGHAGSVNAVSVTPDGRMAVSGSEDNTLIVWDLEAGKILLRLEGHTGAVYAVSLTPDGRKAVSGSKDNTLIVWDLETGMPQPAIKRPLDSICIAGGGGHITVSGSSDHSITFWNLETGKLLHRLKGHTDVVNNVIVTPNGRKAISESKDKTLIVWDLEAGKLIRKIKMNMDHSRFMSMTPDGRRAVLWTWEDTLIICDLEKGETLITLDGIVGSSDRHIVEVTRDGRKVVSVSEEKTLIVSDLETGRTQHRLGGHTAVVNCMALTPDSCKALSGSSDQTLIFWDIKAGKLLHRLEGHSDFISNVVVTPDGRKAVSSSGDDMMIVWDLQTGKLMHKLVGQIYERGPGITLDGLRVVSGDYWSGTLAIWDIVTGKLLHKLDTEFGSDLIVTPDGLKAVSKTPKNTLLVWDLETGKLLQTLMGHTDRIQTVFVTPDGRRAVSGADDKTLIVWDLERGSKIACFPSKSSVNYSIIGSGIIVGGHEGGEGFILHANREVLDLGSKKS